MKGFIDVVYNKELEYDKPALQRAQGCEPRPSPRVYHEDGFQQHQKLPPCCYSTCNTGLGNKVQTTQINTDPSATNTCPEEAMAVAVGLQKCVASLPGTN